MGRGGEWCRNWYRLWEWRARQRQRVGQHGGLFDAYDPQPVRANETVTGRKLRLFLQRDLDVNKIYEEMEPLEVMK